MQYGLHSLFSAAAMWTAPILLLLHIWWKPPRFWVLYFCIAILAVWLAGSASTWLYHNALWEEIQQYEARGAEPPTALREAWASDAGVAMMPMFGWIPGIIYSSVCAVIFLIVRAVCRGDRSLTGLQKEPAQ